MRTLPLVLAMACSGAQPGKIAVSDRDGDGWAVAEGDCDDRDADVYPDAPDPPGDGVDQDCDGLDDTVLGVAGLAVGDLVITEIHRDPVGVDASLSEWFEVHNTRAEPVDLVGLQIRDDAGDYVQIGASLVVEANGYVVFGGWADPEINGGAPVDWPWSGEITLSNGQDELVLSAPGGPEIDAVRWDVRFPDEDGRAMVLDPSASTAEANDLPASWCDARLTDVYGLAGYGTPGEANPACDAIGSVRLEQAEVGDLVITEILQDPLLGDDDGGEWFELLNTRADPINLRGLTVSDDGGGAATVEEDLEIGPGQLLVFGASDDIATNGGVAVDWSWEEAFGLSSGEDALILKIGTRTLDRVRWDNGVNFPDPTGASMALDPAASTAAANDLGVNWCEATTPFGAGDLGTPGVANPSCP